ncbi:MAG: PrsW family intramembrane metalloprotease [Paludibacteraceae bacterium]|nr:PrsW family intramembrane metalloprotease [Paludibacteraceae bacterium]
MYYLMIFAAVLPAVLLGLYIWRKDPHPEPFKWVWRAFLAGVLICLPVAFLEQFIHVFLFGEGEPTTLFGSTTMAFFVAAGPEEGAKLLALWIFLKRCPQFDEDFDCIVYAVFISLGFATVENIGYVLMSGEDWMSTAIMRALLSVPGHYAFAIMMGFYYAMYRFVDPSRKNAAKIFLVPFVAHGTYDAIALSGSVNPVAASVCMLVLIYFCIKLQRAASRKVHELISSNQQNSGQNA